MKKILFLFCTLLIIQNLQAQLILPKEVKALCDSTVRVTDSTKCIAYSRMDGQEFYSECYFPNGKLKHVWYYNGAPVKANGCNAEWFKNGRIKSCSTFIDGQLVGDYFEWHENGNLKVKGSYWIDIRDSVIVKNCNAGKLKDYPNVLLCESVKTGVWKYYALSGIVERSEEWYHGTLKK